MTADPNTGGRSAGVMGATYAEARTRDLPIVFRYRARALAAVDTYLRRKGRPKARIRVLDLGCAEGRTLLEVRRLLGGEAGEAGQAEFHGVELAEDLLARAEDLPEDVHLVRGDVTALPEGLSEGRYDLVTALAVLEHLPSPELCLREARRMLAPGGLLVASAPSPTWDAIAGRLGLVKGEHHEQHMDERELVRLFDSAGFVDIETERFMLSPVASAPYLGVDVSPETAARIDRWARRARLPKALFVNQLVSASRAP